MPSAAAIGQALLATAIGTALEVAAYKYSVADLASNSAMHNEGILTEEEEETKEKNDPLLDNVDKKKKDTSFFPDRPLPRDKDGIPIPDTDAPHTQLETKDGRNGKYIQAREFDKYGRPVKDIDFTDHGKPLKHQNPHQHRHMENKTGGTRKREGSEPLEGWKY